VTEKDTLTDEEIFTTRPKGETDTSGDDDSTDSDSDTSDDADDMDADSDDADDA
jgi:hypothetical protein